MSVSKSVKMVWNRDCFHSAVGENKSTGLRVFQPFENQTYPIKTRPIPRRQHGLNLTSRKLWTSVAGFVTLVAVAAGMVKLPVVVYNRTSRQSVIQDAIQLRCSIERLALAEEAAGGSYIRPIVLFQAQPRTGEDSETFDKIKTMLVDMGISKEEIAIKTSTINDLKNVELLSRNCPIRYIITVNALKEGWDCPFAYILASLANKTSSVDVEQILGRILRQPYAKQHQAQLLNTSYVLTCSNDFQETLGRIVIGLNKAGFSRKDFRIGSDIPAATVSVPEMPVQTDWYTPYVNGEDSFDDIIPAFVRSTLEYEASTDTGLSALVGEAEKQSSEYSDAVSANDGNGFLEGELGDMMNQFSIQDHFIDEVLALRIPQFYLKTTPSMFVGGEYVHLTKEALSDGFTLSGQDAQINFELASGDIYSVDIAETGEAIPKYQRISKKDGDNIREYLASLPTDSKVKTCTDMICRQINLSDRWAAKEINEYVVRIVQNMTADELAALETAVPTYARKIQTKIEMLEDAHREKRFDRLLDSGTVICCPSYTPPMVITPVDKIDSIPFSLYEAEKSDMNGFEFEVLNAAIGLGNIKWWHRIMDRKPGEFVLNGFINHYPDFMLMTKNGVLILLETKGDYLWNDESKAKLRLGRKWQSLAGGQYRYFMVFKEKPVNEDGAYTLDEFSSVIKIFEDIQ